MPLLADYAFIFIDEIGNGHGGRQVADDRVWRAEALGVQVVAPQHVRPQTGQTVSVQGPRLPAPDGCYPHNETTGP
eukprot:11195220-Lingulodinium_polyedra.AAC.1